MTELEGTNTQTCSRCEDEIDEARMLLLMNLVVRQNTEFH